MSVKLALGELGDVKRFPGFQQVVLLSPGEPTRMAANRALLPSLRELFAISHRLGNDAKPRLGVIDYEL